MAGRPKKHADLAKLDEIGKAQVEELLEQGKSIVEVCTELKVSKGALYSWMQEGDGAAALSRARARAADRLATEALVIADSVDETPGAIQKARLRTDIRRWLAGKWDAATYGDMKQPTVQINVAELHLAAVRVHAAEEQPVVVDASTNER